MESWRPVSWNFYISEIAPAAKRGQLVILYQLNIGIGVVIAYVSNYLLGGIEMDAWRWMLGVEAIPAAVYSLLVLGIPNSPRWLVLKKGNVSMARELLLRLQPDSNVEEKLTSIKNSGAKMGDSGFFSGRYNRVILLAFVF